MPNVDATLAERGARYGDFAERAQLAQILLRAMTGHFGWMHLGNDQRQSLQMIVDKISRILNGDADYADNWHDIAGYAKLVENRLTEKG